MDGQVEFRSQNSGARSQEPGARMREPAKTFQDLIVWQKSYKFVLEIYKFTKNFPKSEIYGLSSNNLLISSICNKSWEESPYPRSFTKSR